ncbi:MAG: hypothetical protein OQL09_09650 [Gammaproteobacteria bacterium]|nr:hypothetical protein [Gammaproteobacteria bacterium]
MINLSLINRVGTRYRRAINRQHHALLHRVDSVQSNENRQLKQDRRHLAKRRQS